MSTKLTPADFGAAASTTPAPGTVAAPTALPTLPGVKPQTGPLPAIPGPTFPVPTEGDPAQFVNSQGQTQGQVMEAEIHAEEEAAQTQALANQSVALTRLMQNTLFASTRGEFKVLASFHTTATSNTALDQLVHATLASIYNDAVTRLEQMPAPQG